MLTAILESWLNECTQPQARGRVFSIYMVVNYLGGGIGQQFLNFGGTKDQTSFYFFQSTTTQEFSHTI